MSIKYIKLPIYSVALFGEYIYFSGGGGGTTGIPNQIKVYHRAITEEPLISFSTGKHIIENLTPCEEKGILVCNANDFVVIYSVKESGKELVEAYRFQADFSPKHGNVNALCLSADASCLMTAGEDQHVRFYNIAQGRSDLSHQYCVHSHQIKSVDHNQNDLYLSTDNHLIAVCNLPKKQIIRTLHQDQLLPQKTYFRSAYFLEKDSQKLVIAHFIPRTSTFVTKEQNNGKLLTVEVASDQVSQTAYSSKHQLLGVACANGLTLMLSASNLQVMGEHNQLKSGVNACVISKKKFLISGTSNCSYHVQGLEGSLDLPWTWLLAIAVTFFFIYLAGLGGDWQL